jgi:hypothetical protein
MQLSYIFEGPNPKKMEYKKERDKEFLQTCEKIRKAAGRYISVRETVKKAVRTPATSFFISEREFGKIIRDKKRPPPIPKQKPNYTAKSAAATKN